MNLKKYNWWMVSVLTLIPLIGVFGTLLYSINNGIVWQEPILFILGWWFAGMGITFGYHRLFAHRSFKTHPIIQFIALILGSAALQNSVIKWSSDHRLHHRKLDTDEDPYSITKGFWHAHIGWILEKKVSQIKGIKDLQSNRLLQWQHNHYFKIALTVSFLLPMLIGALYGRPFGGLLWGGFLKLTLVHHFTFFINSLCHYAGKKPFDPTTTARDSWWVAFFTFGEGYHNYHHKFQWDYRNGISWYAFDPGKWTIKFLSWFGLTKDIRTVSEYHILMARLDGMKVSMQSNYNTLPEKIKLNYQLKINKLQENASKIVESWKELENEFNQLKENKIVDKFQLNILKQKRKLYRTEFAGLIHGITIIMVSLKSGNYSF
jgi:stearoyl-CoA desaturase (Delta-9 desaturase)